MAGKVKVKRPGGKTRTSVSLSSASLVSLKRFQRERGLPSTTAAIEALIEEHQRKLRQEQLEAEMAAYYHSLSDEEIEEDTAWGKAGGIALGADE
jgi:hypothetical protein